MGWTKPLKKFLSVLPAPAFWLGVWQACAFLVDRSLDGKGNELRLPYPLSVWNALAAMVGTGEFWAAVLTSLGRIALGLAWGVLLGAARPSSVPLQSSLAVSFPTAWSKSDL